MNTRTFAIGDKVKVAKNAKFLTRIGDLVPTDSAGREAIITELCKLNGNYTLRVVGIFINYNCLPKYLTLISPTFKVGDTVKIAENATVEATANTYGVFNLGIILKCKTTT